MAFTAYTPVAQTNARDVNLDVVWGSRSEQEQEVLPINTDDLAVAKVGRVGHLDPTTKTVLFGLGTGGLPLWMYTSIGAAAGGNSGSSGPSYGINTSNTVGSNFLSGLSPRVLRTFEFETGKVYTLDAPLTVVASGDNRGQLTLWTAKTEPIVGYVHCPADFGKGALSGTTNDCTFSLDKKFAANKFVLQVRTAYLPAATIN